MGSMPSAMARPPPCETLGQHDHTRIDRRINLIFHGSNRKAWGGVAEARINCLPAEHFIGAPLAYIINWCREKKIKVGLTIGLYTPLSFVEESIYDIDRLHIVVHGVDETDGKENWSWRKSCLDLLKRARKLVDDKNPKCEIAIDGGKKMASASAYLSNPFRA